MEPNQDRSIVPRLAHELAAPLIRPNRIVGEMVASSLIAAREPASTSVDLDALVREAKRIQRRQGMTPEDIRAFNMFCQAGLAGHPEGQYQVSDCYRLGFGTQKDHVASLEWLRKSVESGFGLNDSAVSNIRRDTLCGFEGKHIMIYWDLLRKALRQRSDYLTMKKAAEDGPLEALLQFARLFNLIFDLDEAAIWYRKAAERGSAEGQHFIGQCYHVPGSDDIEVDLRYACAWYQLAADQRYAPAVGEAQKLSKCLSAEELASARAIYRELKQKFGRPGEK